MFFALWALCVCAAVPLHQRWREEAHDRRVAIAVEWDEFREFNARLAEPAAQLLGELRIRGVSALVMNPITLDALLAQRRIQPLGSSQGLDPLDVTRIRFSDPELAQQLLTQWSWRGIPGLQLQSEGKTAVVYRQQGSFVALKDADFGFDATSINRVRAAGFTPVLRIFDDPWLPDEHLKDWLNALPDAAPRLGVLFSSDDLPGGTAYSALWRSWISRHDVTQFLPEFKPARAAWQMAYLRPMSAYRLHSIPAAELKELKPKTELSRWHRAVEERSCRLLLARMAPNDSRESYFRSLANINLLLKRDHWKIAFPAPRSFWTDVTRFQRVLSPWLALGIICFVPWIALRAARSSFPHRRTVFWRIFSGCIAGALLAAAIAQTPLTRIEIIPFRGVKWAFLFSWGLTLWCLYGGKELRWMLYQYVRRRDIVFAGLAIGAIGYLVLRSGNAPATFKLGWEQSVRDWLETTLVARPRFKEFAIGYPALWVGCYLQTIFQQRRFPGDARPLIWIGMIGPISTINTFCHLHSPLLIELWRTLNGVFLGVCIGSLFVMGLRRWVLSRPQISFPFAEEEALFYQRSS